MLMSESHDYHQAAGLRTITEPKPVQVLAVTSGKGGVGKTNVSVNLAMSLCMQGRSVMLMDADLGLANVDVMLGLKPTYNLSHVIKGERTLDEVIVEAQQGLKIIPAASGVNLMADLDPMEHVGLIRAFSELSCDLDVLIVDTAAGIADSVIRFSSAAQEVVVVVCDEPTSITDAYALIKVLSRDHGVKRFNVLANKTRGAVDGRQLYEKLSKVAQRFLDVGLNYIGHIPQDSSIRKSVQRQCGVVDQFPTSRAAKAFADIASNTLRWPAVALPNGNIEFFAERLVAALPERSATQW